MKTITIKRLTPELNADYLDFFDNRAFTDDNPNGPCYCTSPNQDEKTIRQMVSEFDIFGVKETLRKYAVEMLEKNIIQGYLAYDGETAVGWCNAVDTDSYSGFVPDFARKNSCGKTVSIVCFEIAPEYRGMGIASAFIERICSDAKTNGYAAVEGYARLSGKQDDFDYHGPLKLYQKAGFTEAARENEQVVMRKILVPECKDNAAKESAGITFKKLTEEELEAFIGLRIRQLTEEYTSENREVPENVDLKSALFDYYHKHMLDGTFVSWLAMDGNTIVGTSGMSFVEKPPYFTCPSGKLGLLSSMYTEPDHRRMGIARELLHRVVEEAKSYGCGSVHITASDMGVKLYTAYGFKHNGNFMMYNL